MHARLAEPALLDVQHAEIGERARLAPMVLHAAGNVARPFELRDRGPDLPLRLQHAAEHVERLPLGGAIAERLCSAERGFEVRARLRHASFVQVQYAKAGQRAGGALVVRSQGEGGGEVFARFLGIAGAGQRISGDELDACA